MPAHKASLRMKTKLLIIALLGFFVSSLASAATLTVSEVLELKAGLQALDGQPTLVPAQGDQPAKVVSVPYKFSSDARWKIFSALTAVKGTLDTFEAARQDLVKRMGLDTDPKNEAKLTAFTTEISKDLARKTEVKLPTLSRAELNLTENAIPGSVLAALAPVIGEK